MNRYETNWGIKLEAATLEEAKKEAMELWTPMSSCGVTVIDTLTDSVHSRDFHSALNNWSLGPWYEV